MELKLAVDSLILPTLCFNRTFMELKHLSYVLIPVICNFSIVTVSGSAFILAKIKSSNSQLKYAVTAFSIGQ